MRDGCLIHAARKGQAAALVAGPPSVLLDPVVNRRIARSRIEGRQGSVNANPRHVGDPTYVHKGNRPGFERLCKGPVIGGHQRGTLASRAHIGGAQIISHGNTKRLGKCWTIAQLHGQTTLRTMDDSLAVKAD